MYIWNIPYLCIYYHWQYLITQNDMLPCLKWIGFKCYIIWKSAELLHSMIKYVNTIHTHEWWIIYKLVLNSNTECNLHQFKILFNSPCQSATNCLICLSYISDNVDFFGHTVIYFISCDVIFWNYKCFNETFFMYVFFGMNFSDSFTKFYTVIID